MTFTPTLETTNSTPHLTWHHPPCEHTTGPHDQLAISAVLELIHNLPIWPPSHSRRTQAQARVGASMILEWLASHLGAGWQERWQVARGDDYVWIDHLAGQNPRQHCREDLVIGLRGILLARVVRPSYGFFARFVAQGLFNQAQRVFAPDLFARLDQLGPALGVSNRSITAGKKAIVKIALHTGKAVEAITEQDVFEMRTAGLQQVSENAAEGVHPAWELLREAGVLSTSGSLRETLRRGQQPTHELVDRYGLQCREVRGVLVRYLDERRPSMDYSGFRSLAYRLAGLFWADLERHHPGLDTLRLPHEVADAWKQRVTTVTRRDGTTGPRKDYHGTLMTVRGFYLDLQEWALQDPSWAPWAAPSPVHNSDTKGYLKERKRTTAEMYQRVRDRLPHLPRMAEVADQHRRTMAELLDLAQRTAIGETFDHHGTRYRHQAPTKPRRQRELGPAVVKVTVLDTGDELDLTRAEDEAYWSWAILETFRHTGIRIEELLELTHLALVSYRLPDTGEVVPLLQIVPSKSNEERVLLISPELASVLASIVSRLRQEGGGSIPPVRRYDLHERTTGHALPHLFQRYTLGRRNVISATLVRKFLADVAERAGVTDNAGQPLQFTAHDFRRLFATDAVTGGLPVHLAAKLLGHDNLATTQSYLAVFDEDIVRTYRSFLDKRRAIRPETEYREPTEQEWTEFHQHFQERKLELGTCGRPYGSPCQHEHACIRCPMLRMDPNQRTRLVEIIRNLGDRIQEAKLNGWLGEVEGLTTSLTKAKEKLVSLDRTYTTGPTELGIPTIGPR